jgi:hypothetical protein
MVSKSIDTRTSFTNFFVFLSNCWIPRASFMVSKSIDTKTSFTNFFVFLSHCWILRWVHCKWRAGENPIQMSGSHWCIPRNETIISKTELLCSVSQFLHSYICERFIHFQDWSAYSAAGKICGPILGKYKSLTDTWMWKLGLRPQNSRQGIHKWDFPCSVEYSMTNWPGQWASIIDDCQ